MRRSALLALIVVLSVPAAVGVVPADAPGTGADVSPSAAVPVSVLRIADPAATGFATASIDVGTSVALQRGAAETRLDRYALEFRFRNASEDRRDDVLFDAAIERQRRSESLRAEERSLRSAYRNGSIGTAAFVRGLARLDARAADLRGDLDRIGTLSEEVSGFSLGRRLQAIDTTLVGFGGPVRDRALASVRGRAPPIRVYVEASSDGVGLAAIDGGRYLRETYRADRRSDGSDGSDFDRIVARFRATYSEAFNESVQWRIGTLGGGTFRVTFELQGGSIVAYLDGATEDVFYEVHDRELATLAGSEVAEGVENGTRVVVNRSVPGGPLRIATYDNATGRPVGTEVVVAGTRLDTGPDGVAWTLTPRTQRFTVTAVRPGGNATVFVRPLPFPAGNVTA